MIRVATYNIRHGSLKGVEAILEVLRGLDADLIALQEVDRVVSRSGGTDQAKFLGEGLGMESAFAPAMPHDGGEYGVALLSRMPIVSHRVLGLPSPFEPRVMLRATVEWGSAPLEMVVTHLGLHPMERQRQVSTILARLGPMPKRTILCGDLNEGHTEAGFALFGQAWVDCLDEAGVTPLPTYPSHHPVIGIDHVLRTPDLPPARLAVAIPTLASDHLPVLVQLG